MTSNYGWDANGMEREPFPARDEHAERHAVAPMAERTRAHRLAVKAHPDCEECRRGKGILTPGPGHCKDHDRHCSAAPCW